jgi:hypothetical protein
MGEVNLPDENVQLRDNRMEVVTYIGITLKIFLI